MKYFDIICHDNSLPHMNQGPFSLFSFGPSGGITMAIILPSIASANQANLAGEIHRLGSHPYLHFDLEDGNFVPNITFGIKTVRALRPLTTASFDAHLMVTNPMDYIPSLLALDFRGIAFHWESTGYPLRIIHAIHDGGCRAGIALNPRTCAQEVIPYLGLVDYLLVMTAEPDGHGDQFQPMVLENILQLHTAAPDLPIVADGAVNSSILPLVCQAGASAVVMGRAVFTAPDPLRAIHEFSNR